MNQFYLYLGDELWIWTKTDVMHNFAKIFRENEGGQITGNSHFFLQYFFTVRVK